MVEAILVSGNDETLYLYKVAIEFQGIMVKTAKTVKEAAKLLAKSVPDIIVLDLSEFEISDLEPLKPHKAKAKNMPVIILADFDSMDKKESACIFGACKYLEKEKTSLNYLIKTVRGAVK